MAEKELCVPGDGFQGIEQDREREREREKRRDRHDSTLAPSFFLYSSIPDVRLRLSITPPPILAARPVLAQPVRTQPNASPCAAGAHYRSVPALQDDDDFGRADGAQDPPTPASSTAPTRPRRRRCFRISLLIALTVLVLLVVFAAYCNPYRFVSLVSTLSTGLFRGPYWSRDPQSNWLLRLFFRPRYAKGCWPRQRRIRSQELQESVNTSAWWTSGSEDPHSWSSQERELRDIPSYVLDYAPLIHLHADEKYWPGDIAEHLLHTTPYQNYTPIGDCSFQWNLSNLNQLNDYGRFIYLQSNDNIEKDPDWLLGAHNVPIPPKKATDGDDEWTHQHSDAPEPPPYDRATIEAFKQQAIRQHADDLTKRKSKRASPKPIQSSARHGGRSNAPAVLLVVPKPDGIVDAFWFFFYSYNQGNAVFGIRFGHHVGDWEHTLVRFQHGKPVSIFFSEHFFGEAYSYEAAEKYLEDTKRPIGYSGIGTHAMYGTPGIHKYILPLGLLHDETSRGPLWDPRMNVQAYTYDYRNDTLRASTLTPKAPTEWFYFMGHWGDKAYPMSDPRQYRFAGEYHYVNGPLGPRFKNLRRKKVCQGRNDPCNIKEIRDGAEQEHDRSSLPMSQPEEQGEEMTVEDQKQFLNGTDADALVEPEPDVIALQSEQDTPAS